MATKDHCQKAPRYCNRKPVHRTSLLDNRQRGLEFSPTWAEVVHGGRARTETPGVTLHVCNDSPLRQATAVPGASTAEATTQRSRWAARGQSLHARRSLETRARKAPGKPAPKSPPPAGSKARHSSSHRHVESEDP